MMRNNNRLLLLCSALLIAVIQGCGTQPPDTGPSPDDQQVETTPDGRELTEIEKLLLQAETSAPLEKTEYTLQAAERLFADNRMDQADQLLQSLNPLMLSAVREQQFWLLRARIAATRLQPQLSLDWMSRITQPDLLSEQQQALLTELEISALSQLGDSTTSLNSLIERSAMADDELRPQLNNAIWNLLNGLSTDEIRIRQSNQDNDYLQQGWYDLALLSRESGTDILRSSQMLLSWQHRWNLHPAATHLPAQLATIFEHQTRPASHIAVLLPQSGKLARPAGAIIEGLLAAYYQDQRLGRPTPRLSFYDSTRIPSLTEFYQTAALNNVELIIGPLDKNRLAELAFQTEVAIPTLAMNYSESASATLNLFQFGLRGEDEARQAARRAWNDGHRRALSLTPATGWGRRIHSAFQDEWQRLGGQLVRHQSFSGENDFSERISQLLSVDASEARMKELRRFVGEKLEFNARRRQDVDFIFLSALAGDARQIKPTLAFHYASSLPVYATSHVYSGTPSAEKDQDLNGIMFCDIPWVLNRENPIRADLELFRTDTQTRFGKLYALGSDAYRISPYLNQLQAVEDSFLHGESGRLTVDARGHIIRNLDWARFKNGLARPLAP